MTDSGRTASSGCGVALLGALVAQPLAFLLAFLAGAIFGAHEINFMNSPPPRYGWQGGENAIGALFVVYLLSFGIAPVIVSSVGAGVAVAIWGDIHFRQSRRLPGEQLQRVLDANCLPCGAVIAPTGEVIARAGDFDGFAGAGLVSDMLGPKGSAAATYHLVKNPEQGKPIVFGQGSDFAFLDRAGELVVVVFGSGRGDVHAQYALSQGVAQSIVAEFGSHTRARIIDLIETQDVPAQR